MRAIFLLLISTIISLFMFTATIKLLDLSDKDLEFLGPVSNLMAWAIPKQNIPDRLINAGTLIETEFLPGGIITPSKSKVITTEGTFIVVGPVSAFKGQQVKISGLSDDRLEKNLLIGSKKYTLSDVPEV